MGWYPVSFTIIVKKMSGCVHQVAVHEHCSKTVWDRFVLAYTPGVLRVFCSDGFPYVIAPAFSTPAFSTPAIYSCIFHSCIFHSRIFSAPINCIINHALLKFSPCHNASATRLYRGLVFNTREKMEKINNLSILRGNAGHFLGVVGKRVTVYFLLG